MGCFSALLNFSIQRGQWLGDWQDILRKWDLEGKTNRWHFMGGCVVCTAHFLAFCSIPVYTYTTWQYDDLVVRMFLYNFICAVSNFLFMTKLFN